MTEMLTAVVASDHPILWTGLCEVCTLHGFGTLRAPRDRGLADVIDDATPAAVAIDLLDVVKVDLHVEIATTCEILSASAHRPAILVLADGAEELDPLQLLGCGARGLFTPDTSLDLFPRAIESICSGELWWPRRQLTIALDSLSPAKDAVSGDDDEGEVIPSARELSVLRLLADGRNHLEIADELGLSAHTVRTHIRNIMRKLDVHSRTEAVQVALEWGLVDLDDRSTS